MLTAGQWARQQFGPAELGDKRRTERAVKLAEAVASAAGASLPALCGRWKDTKAAYRLLDKEQVTFQSLSRPHRRLTLSSARGCAVVLHVSDTTTLSFAYRAARDLGPTGSGGSGRGMLLHSTLAVDVSGGTDAVPEVLGLSAHQLWARDTDSAPAVESSKWAGAIDAIGTPPQAVRWIHVGDCESDCWEAVEACRSHHMGFALRACQDRQVIGGHAQAGRDLPAGRKTTLFELLDGQPVLGGKRLWVRGRKDREPRWAKLAVSATPLTLLAPKNWPDKPHRKGVPRPRPVACWAVRVYEIDPPGGEDAIEWVILTDEPAADLETALKVVFWYSCRWLIEEYHKCLKTGCRAEDRQLETADCLGALLGILSVTAVRLLQLKHQARCNPQRPAREVVPGEYVQVLAAHRKMKSSNPTVREFWRAVAQMGGFLARKSDGDPGWLTLWRGWQKLDLLVEGARIAHTRRR